MSKVQRLTFRISDIEILKFEINHETKLVKTLYVRDEIGAKAILLENERTYTGIEKRLNYYMATNYSLLEMIDIINEGRFYADMQHNLNIIVEDIC
ncbi:hypothetical protein [Streptococcus suis]|uniref:hypothetical protein n=1 Tax=Streptococcus suis TaxID=1307 RepID=UPI000492C31F|nr:hypothetical protein [Streptococcus suis]MBM7284952.1 hypothetical protein [Streptococcus suis]MCO8236954.1 hypothetical protein [Streptococcus suis]HEM3533514.1 hypothetical protein [Streptococcus suis]